MSPLARLESAKPLLGRFPKSRPDLPTKYRDVYSDMYQNNRKGRDPAAATALFLEKWMHRDVSRASGFPLLEIGAGTLNHIPFEAIDGLYDAVEPMRELYEGSQNRSRVRNIYPSVHDVPDGSFYRRIISIAVLEHVVDLPSVLARSALALKDDGQMLAGIPSEGGLLWHLAWRFGTGMTFRLRYGLSYATFMRYEHINTAAEIEAVIRLFFRKVVVRRFPTPLKHASLYSSLRAVGPDYDLARAYLESQVNKCA